MIVKILQKDSTETAIRKINREIATRRKLGVRSELIPTTNKLYKLVWSNASRRWFVWKPELNPYTGRPTRCQSVDSNEILVQGCEFKVLEALVPSLDPLPLYRRSCEYNLRLSERI